MDCDPLRLDFILDLPSRDDTCFAGVLPRGEGRYRLYNYTSPLDGPDVPRGEGQIGPTIVYRTMLEFSGR